VAQVYLLQSTIVKPDEHFGYQDQLKSRENGFDPHDIQTSGRLSVHIQPFRAVK
jgi:hypothetical protein